MKKIIGILFSLLLLTPSLNGDEIKIILVKKKGKVYYWDIARKKWEDLPEKSQLRVGIFIKTGKDSEAIIAFGKKAVITISENSAIRIAESLFEKDEIKKVKIQNFKGKIWSLVEKIPSPEKKFEIEAPNAIAAVRGTVFMVKYKREDNSTRVAVIKGEVIVSSKITRKFIILREKNEI